MKKRHKVYLKLNLVSIFFMAVSFISITLAWFAYSGIASLNTDINVKAWYIEFEKDGEAVSNDIVISFDDIYPGMETISEEVKINNKGDSDAKIDYQVVSARILGDPLHNYEMSESVSSLFIEDKLSHEYPFHINVNLDKNFVLAENDSSSFEISVSWPLDSNNDASDSYWGNEAYVFQKNEEELYKSDSSYQIRPSLKLEISLKAEQYVEEESNYALGSTILFDFKNDVFCGGIGGTCINSYVIGSNNTTVELLPDIYNDYGSATYSGYDQTLNGITNGWKSPIRALALEDILKVISTDINNSFVVLNGKYSSVIGNLKYGSRMSSIVNNTTQNNGYYIFLNASFPYLSSNRCYWLKTGYTSSSSFSFIKYDGTTSRILETANDTVCNVVPVVSVLKTKLI